MIVVDGLSVEYGPVRAVRDVSLELVWDPPWNPDMMSEAAKLTLNF